jgi:hypothetical protein
MFSRTSLERRIMELEQALTEVNPDHPLLTSSTIPGTAS